MKSLSQYIYDYQKTPKIIGEYQNKYKFEYNNSYMYSFERFCEDNKVDFNDKEMFEAAVACFDEYHWTYNTYDRFFGPEFGQEFFYETLTHSLEGERFEEYLQKNFEKVVSTEKEDYRVTDLRYNILVTTDKDIQKDSKWQSALNLFNYSCIRTFKNDGYWIYKLQPNISEEVTDEIYKEKYLYHITAKKFADKIMRVGFHPKPYRYLNWAKTYFFQPQKDIEYRLHSQFTLRKRIENWPDTEECKPVLIRVDLSKLKPKTRFFKDSKYTGVRAVYTFEPISVATLTSFPVSEENFEHLKILPK